MANITIEEAIRGNEIDDVLGYFKEASVSANDTAEVYTRGFSNFLVWIKLDGACTITLDAVSPLGKDYDSQYSIDSFVSIAETVKAFTGAGSDIIDLNEIITAKKALKANFLRFKFSAGVTASFAVIGKLLSASDSIGIQNRDTFYTGTKTVTAAGTAEQLPTKAVPDGFPVTIKAMRANTGYIYVGESKAQAEAHNFELCAKEPVKLYLTNINEGWIDASVSGEGCEIIVEV